MNLSRIWRIKQIEEGVIHRGRRPRWMTASEKKINCLELIKKASLWLALSSSLVIFWGTTEHFLGKNGELRWNILSGETKITKLPWQRSVRPQCQDGVGVLKCYELRCQDIKNAIQNLNTRNSASKRILSGCRKILKILNFIQTLSS